VLSLPIRDRFMPERGRLTTAARGW
jgi:hypothetical protein